MAELVEGLVNLVTPAYNSAGHISRLLDSVLIQTYPMIKMYVVDDGSTDNTREVIIDYIPLFVRKGYELKYVYQENAGQSCAINNALKLVDGEFLLWPDSDDWYKEPDSIEKLVETLKGFDDEVGVARCRYEFVSDHTFQAVRTNVFPNYGIAECISDDAIHQRNGFVWYPGGYVVKTKLLDKFIPNRNIYTEKNAGQNFQLLFPYLVNSKCVSIDAVLYCYLLREGSQSRSNGFEKRKRKVEAYIRTYINTMDTMSTLGDSKRDEYKKYILPVFYSKLLKNDVENQETNSFRQHVRECKRLNAPLSKRNRRLYWWTKLFGIKSYMIVGKFFNKLSA